MKLNKIFMAVCMSSVMVSGIAMADGQGSGKVTFNGEIINAPCSVVPESVEQVVQMGQISNKALLDGGESNSSIFTIGLQNCVIDEENDAVKVIFSGGSDPYDPALLPISGRASGAGIQMRGAGGAPIVIGQATPAQNIINGDQELTFSATLKGYAADIQATNPVVPGDFQATTNFALSYE